MADANKSGVEDKFRQMSDKLIGIMSQRESEVEADEQKEGSLNQDIINVAEMQLFNQLSAEVSLPQT